MCVWCVLMLINVTLMLPSNYKKPRTAGGRGLMRSVSGAALKYAHLSISHQLSLEGVIYCSCASFYERV